VRDPLELCRQLKIDVAYHEAAMEAARQFPLLVPQEYLCRMQPGNPHDPLLRQVLPLADELASVPGFSSDPVGDAAATQQPGLLQKYARRALIVTTGACAVHCRYCFRRHFPYATESATQQNWDACRESLVQDRSLDECILSGGDPLMLPDNTLASRIADIEAIDHITRLRVHTRLPIVVPQRVTEQLLDVLGGTRLVVIVVLHANHPAELDEATTQSLARLVEAGIPLLNQAVLLRGVNDDVATLEALCLELVNHRVIPYYLHQLDRVAGAAHFEVPTETGQRLVQQLQDRLPGYAVPRFVRDQPGSAGKSLLA
jgi:EF-P beta-lysylation protein EpmB